MVSSYAVNILKDATNISLQHWIIKFLLKHPNFPVWKTHLTGANLQAIIVNTPSCFRQI